MSRWQIARVSEPCDRGMCERTIDAGQPYRLMSAANLKYCTACAGEEPPDNLEPLPIIEQVSRFGNTSPFSRFDRAKTATTVRNAILDVRQRQAGERE